MPAFYKAMFGCLSDATIKGKGTYGPLPRGCESYAEEPRMALGCWVSVLFSTIEEVLFLFRTFINEVSRTSHLRDGQFVHISNFFHIVIQNGPSRRKTRWTQSILRADCSCSIAMFCRWHHAIPLKPQEWRDLT